MAQDDETAVGRPTRRTVNDGETTRIDGVLVNVRRKPGKGRRYRVSVRPAPVAVDNAARGRQDST